MASLSIEGSDLTVQLSPWEKLGALSGDVRVPLASVRSVHVTDRPYDELRGMRVGTGIPFVIVLGRMIYADGKDFVAIYGRAPTTVIELNDAPYKRIMVSGDHAAMVDRLNVQTARRPTSV